MDKKLKDKKQETHTDEEQEVITEKKAEDKVQEKQNEQQLESKIKDLEDQLKRAVADYRNLERRSMDERHEAVKFANKQLLESLLPAFDTLFLAGKFTEDESVRLTINRILEVLNENGIEKVTTDNAKYNAEVMEAVEAVEGESEKVIEEVRPGFMINGKLIRPAQVKVGMTEQN